MSSFSTNTRTMSPLHDINYYQLCRILRNFIPRADALHKTVDFITRLQLDGKTFMTLSEKKLADLANHDEVTIDRFKVLRLAPSDVIGELLRPRRECTIDTQEVSKAEGLQNEGSMDPISNPASQSPPLDIGPSDAETTGPPPDPDLHNLTLDTADSVEAAHRITNVDVEGENPQISIDAAHRDLSGPSLPHFNSDATRPDETSPGFGPAVALEPHTIPLPQSDDPELDLLNVEENDIHHDQVSSDEEAVGSDLESDGFSANDTALDDERQAASVNAVGHEVGEVHVSVENEDEDLQAEEESSSSSDVIRASYTEDPSVTLEEPEGGTAPAQCPHVDVEPLSAAQSLPADQSDPGIDQNISAGVNSPSSVSKDSDVEHSLPTHGSAEQNEEHDLSCDIHNDLPTNVSPASEPSGDERESQNPTSETVNTPPDEGLESSPIVFVVSTPEQLSARSFESVTPDDRAIAADELPSPGLSNTEDQPGIAQFSPNEQTSETVVDDSPEVQMDSELATNEKNGILKSISHPPNSGEADSGETHSESEQSPPTHNSPEVHVESGCPADDSETGVGPIEKESGSLHFEALTGSADNEVLITHTTHSPANLSFEFDMSPSTSPSSSSRSLFSDSPFSAYPDFSLLSPLSPVWCLEKGSVLFVRERGYEDHSISFHVGQCPRTSAGFEEIDREEDSGSPTATEFRLVDHPSDESSQDGELGSPSYIPSIDFLDGPEPELLFEVGSEGLSASGSVSLSVKLPSLNEHETDEANYDAPDTPDGVPDDSLPSIPGADEGQLSDTEASALYDDSVSDEPSPDEPASEAGVGTLHVNELSKFRELPPIDTSIPSLLRDSEISAFLSPQDCDTSDGIVHTAPHTPSLARFFSGSPARTLFPLSEGSASERRIASYTKRLNDTREARGAGIVACSPVSDVAVQTDAESLPWTREESSIIGSLASSLVSPITSFFFRKD